MTIHQSRYGGAAEVGRAHVEERKKDSKKPLITIAGGTAALGGGITASTAQGKLSGARAAHASHKAFEEKANVLFRQRDVRPLMRHDIGVKGPNQKVSAHFFENKLKELGEKTKQADRSVRRIRNIRTAGLAALASGLGVMGASAVHNERSRGTIGYKRPASRQEAMRQAMPMSAAQARHRRMNGL